MRTNTCEFVQFSRLCFAQDSPLLFSSPQSNKPKHNMCAHSYIDNDEKQKKETKRTPTRKKKHMGENKKKNTSRLKTRSTLQRSSQLVVRMDSLLTPPSLPFSPPFPFPLPAPAFFHPEKPTWVTEATPLRSTVKPAPVNSSYWKSAM